MWEVEYCKVHCTFADNRQCSNDTGNICVSENECIFRYKQTHSQIIINSAVNEI